MSPDVAASLRARLLRKAKERGEEFELFLVRFAIERFLYRLGASPHRDRCVLKGAALLTLWMDDPYRASRDVDLLASGPSDEAAVRDIVTTICEVPCAEDGVRFDVASIQISPIREEDKYSGHRAVLLAYLGSARIRMQVDFGFGDEVKPPPEDAEYRTLLDHLPAPSLRTYPRVVSVAEKFHAMVTLGRRNSRMKDFHDVWALTTAFAFDGRALREAMTTCFERRDTPWTSDPPDVLTSAFYDDPALRDRWGAYLRAGGLRTPPPARFETIGERVRAFLDPVQQAVAANVPFGPHWDADGPWR